jgi:hypothetical protein
LHQNVIAVSVLEQCSFKEDVAARFRQKETSRLLAAKVEAFNPNQR